MVTGRQLWTTAGIALVALLVQRYQRAFLGEADPMAMWIVMSFAIVVAVALGYVAGSFRASLVLAPLFVLLRFAYSVVWVSVARPHESVSIFTPTIGTYLLTLLAQTLVVAQLGVLFARFVVSRRALSARRS